MVHFGTSGWRGVIGRDITFRKVRQVTQAILDTVIPQDGKPHEIIVGYDTRMLSEKFARSAAALIAGNGFEVRLPERDIPSPVLSSAILERKADAGIIFTASHNPPEYNGLKLYTSDGILAPSEVTDPVEVRYRELEGQWDDVYLPQPHRIVSCDPKPTYLQRLQELIDWEAIRKSGLTVVVDPLFGTSREYLDHILMENGVPVTVIHNTRDPFFGGYAPECTSENLTRLRDVMRQTGADLGLSTDGDGDRFGILDHGARLKESNLALALVLDYLARRRGLKGKVGKTVATSLLVDAVARHHDLEVVETTVGFKNFGPLLVDGTLEFAAEESAGLAWAKHLPERDGILACFLVTEMVAVEGRSMYELGQDLYRRVGTYYFRRTQVPLTRQLDQVLQRRFQQEIDRVDGLKVAATDRRDGLKLTFEGGGWLLIRKAGTEPKVRIYAEGRSKEEMRHLLHLAKKLLSNWRLSDV